MDVQNFTLKLLAACRSPRRRNGDKIEWDRSWRRHLDLVNSRLNGATGLMQVTNILRVAAMELVSSVELLRVALVGPKLKGADLEEESGERGGRRRGERRARRSATSSFPTPVNGGRQGGRRGRRAEDQILEIKF
jgi:hypothetical protein